MAEFEIVSDFEVVSEPTVPRGALPVTSPVAGRILAETEQERQARQNSIFDVLGDSYDPTTTMSEGFFTQMDMSRSNALEDKQKKFRRDFPEGSLISIPVEGDNVFFGRTNVKDRYREMALSPQIAGAVLSEPFLLGMAGSLTLGPLGTLLGVGGGVLLESEIEEARGFGQDAPGLGQAVKEGATAATVELIFRGFGRFVFGPRNPPAIQQGLVDAVRASRELGLEPLAVGQLGGPFQRGVFRQVGVTSPRIERKITAEELSLLEAVKKEAGRLPEGTTDAVLLAIVRAQQDELSALIRLPSLRRADAGTALNEGLETYRKASARLRNRLYDKAIELSDDVSFNLRSAQAIARDVKTGVRGRGKETTRTEVSPIVDEFDRPITREIKERAQVAIAETPEGKLAEVISDILKLEPNVSKFAVRGKKFTGFEQIKTLRTRLFDLKQSDDGAVRREATRLWKSLTGVMDNPVSGDPGFTRAYKTASTFNRIREDTLSKTFVARALRNDTPETLARTYMAPGHATELCLTNEKAFKFEHFPLRCQKSQPIRIESLEITQPRKALPGCWGIHHIDLKRGAEFPPSLDGDKITKGGKFGCYG